VIASLGLCLAGCAATATIENPHPVAYMPEREPPSSLPSQAKLVDSSWAGASASCSLYGPDELASAKDHNTGHRGSSLHRNAPPSGVRLSRGDVVNVMIPDGKEFTGDYTIGPDGTLSLPYIRGLRASGRSESELESEIRGALIRRQFFSSELARVAVRVVHYSAIHVRVQGAVFQPGTHTINEPQGNNSEADIALKAGRTFGATTIRRTLTAALRVAAGVRPDADISRVELVRRGRGYVLDLRGVLTGGPVVDPVLEDGDEVRVPSRFCFQPELVRPSQITPRGIRIYLSKIHFGADARYDEKVPYGLRLLQAAILGSCIGGPKPTRGHREIVLVSTNPVTRRTEVIQRSVESLLRAKHRDSINPYLMPDDSVACYDSPAAEAMDFATFVNTLLTPVKTFRTIQKPPTN
jgi:polysaccharide biosynthesis/export protein